MERLIRPTLPRPKAVIFDVGFALTFLDADMIAEISTNAGMPMSSSDVESAIPRLRRENAETKDDRPRFIEVATPGRSGDGVNYLSMLFNRLLVLACPKLEIDPILLLRTEIYLRREHLKKNLWRIPGPGVRDAMKSLRNDGIKIGIVSNSEGNVEAMLEDVGLRKFCDVVIDSAVVGVSKPDRAIYEKCLRRLGGEIKAHETFMVGDTPSADVFGARAVGMPAALIDPLDIYPWVDAPKFASVPAFVSSLLEPYHIPAT